MKSIRRGLLLLMFIMLSEMMQAEKRVTIKWLHTSDVHGQLLGYDVLERHEVSMGYSWIYGYVKPLRDKFSNVVLSDGGDVLQGSPSVYYYNFIDTVSTHLAADVMNAMGYDVACLGNHDIETGHSVYDRWMDECNFPFVGANIIDEHKQTTYVKPYHMLQREGVRIAVLGLLTPAIPYWLPRELWTGLYFEEMVQCAQKWIDLIKKKEHPHLIVGLFHSGMEGGIKTSRYAENAVRQVAEQISGLDLICYGHDHHPNVEWINNSNGDSVLCMAPAPNGKLLCEADIEVVLEDDRLKERFIHARLIDLRKSADAAVVADFEKEFSLEYQEVDSYVQMPIGHFTQDIYCRDAYFGPSAFIDLIHRLQLDISGAQISLAAPLDFDSVIKSGVARVADMFRLYKYENQLYTMRLSGREIKGVLEMSYAQWTNTMVRPDDPIMLMSTDESDKAHFFFKNMVFNFDSAAGIIYTVDVTKPEGEKITIQSMADGQPFSADEYYTVAVNSYRGNGGGELLTLGAGIPHEELESRIISATEKDLRFYLMEYIKRYKEIDAAPLNQWRFVPEEWTKKACERDRKLLFKEE